MKFYPNTEENEPLERLRQRAILSARTLEDRTLLEWILNKADLIFESYRDIHISLAQNPNISLRTFMILASSKHREVREAVLLNPAISAGILYGLTFDIDPKIRQQATSHPEMTEQMNMIAEEVKSRHGSLLNKHNRNEPTSLVADCVLADVGVEMKDIALLSALKISYSEPRYWEAFADDSGYAKWYLRRITEEATSILLQPIR